MRIAWAELRESDLRAVFKALDFTGTDRISLGEWLKFVGLSGMVATTEHAKAKATLEQELAWTDQEQRYRRQKAVQETLDAPLYGPWYPAMAHSIQDWKPPTFYEEELKYVHALLTDSLQMAWR